MNKAIMSGRLTRDPEVRYTQDNQTCIANFTLAVDRRFKSEEQSADFINFVAFGKTAEHIEKCYRKGMKANVCGRIQVRNYTNRDGVKVYVTEVVVEEIEFGESKNAGNSSQRTAPQKTESSDPLESFMSIPDGFDGDDIPFN